MYSLYWRSVSGRLSDALDPADGHLDGMAFPQPAVLAVPMLARAVRDSKNLRFILNNLQERLSPSCVFIIIHTALSGLQVKQ